MMKKINILILFVMFGCYSNAQNSITGDEHNKYWFYKDRLHKQFVFRGLQDPMDCNSTGGHSIPAAFIQRNGKNTIEWYDDNLWHLGTYIGVLATEYRLLKNNSQDTDETLEELYYAMMAYERLDVKSKTLTYPYVNNGVKTTPNCSTSVNGFFIRGDLANPAYYAEPRVVEDQANTNINSADLTTYLKQNSGYADFFNQYDKVCDIERDATLKYFVHLRNSQSDPDQSATNFFYDEFIDDEDHAEFWSSLNIFPSPDQISSLLLGFALVKKCLPSNEHYNGYYFEDRAIFYSYKMGEYLDNNNWIGIVEGTNNVPYRHGDKFRKESGYGIAKAIDRITSGSQYASNFSSDPILLSNPTHAFHLSFAAPALGVSVNTAIGAFGNRFMSNHMQISAAIGDSWYWNGINTTGRMLASYGLLLDQGINSLLHAYLHNDEPKFPIGKDYFKDRIEDAPCEGPLYKPTGDYSNTGVNGWRAVNRWWHPTEANQGGRTGRFNGLDFMLLFNLYNLVYTDEAYTNYRDVYFTNKTINYPIPYSNANFTCNSTFKFLSFNTLTVGGNTEIRNGSRVEMKAISSIVFKPGFTTNGTSVGVCSAIPDIHNTLHAYIGEPACSNVPTNYYTPVSTTNNFNQPYTVSDNTPDHIYSVSEDENLNQSDENNAESPVVSVKPRVSVYPNPSSNGIFYFQCEGVNTQQMDVLVFDMYGKLVENVSGLDSGMLDLSNHSAGMYCLKISDGTNVFNHRISFRK